MKMVLNCRIIWMTLTISTSMLLLSSVEANEGQYRFFRPERPRRQGYSDPQERGQEGGRERGSESLTSAHALQPQSVHDPTPEVPALYSLPRSSGDFTSSQGPQPESRVTQGSQPQSRFSQGNQPDSRVTQGSQPESRITQGSQPESRVTQGNQPESRITQGSQPESTFTQGNQPESRVTQGADPNHSDRQGATTELSSTSAAAFEDSSDGSKTFESGDDVSEIFTEVTPSPTPISPSATQMALEPKTDVVLRSGMQDNLRNGIKSYGGYSNSRGRNFGLPGESSSDDFDKRKLSNLIVDNLSPPPYTNNEIPRVYSVRPINDQQQVENNYFQIKPSGLYRQPMEIRPEAGGQFRPISNNNQRNENDYTVQSNSGQKYQMYRHRIIEGQQSGGQSNQGHEVNQISENSGESIVLEGLENHIVDSSLLDRVQKIIENHEKDQQSFLQQYMQNPDQFQVRSNQNSGAEIQNRGGYTYTGEQMSHSGNGISRNDVNIPKNSELNIQSPGANRGMNFFRSSKSFPGNPNLEFQPAILTGHFTETRDERISNENSTQGPIRNGFEFYLPPPNQNAQNQNFKFQNDVHPTYNTQNVEQNFEQLDHKPVPETPQSYRQGQQPHQGQPPNLGQQSQQGQQPQLGNFQPTEQHIEHPYVHRAPPFSQFSRERPPAPGQFEPKPEAGFRPSFPMGFPGPTSGGYEPMPTGPRLPTPKPKAPEHDTSQNLAGARNPIANPTLAGTMNPGDTNPNSFFQNTGNSPLDSGRSPSTNSIEPFQQQFRPIENFPQQYQPIESQKYLPPYQNGGSSSQFGGRDEILRGGSSSSNLSPLSNGNPNLITRTIVIHEQAAETGNGGALSNRAIVTGADLKKDSEGNFDGMLRKEHTGEIPGESPGVTAQTGNDIENQNFHENSNHFKFLSASAKLQVEGSKNNGGNHEGHQQQHSQQHQGPRPLTSDLQTPMPRFTSEQEQRDPEEPKPVYGIPIAPVLGPESLADSIIVDAVQQESNSILSNYNFNDGGRQFQRSIEMPIPQGMFSRDPNLFTLYRLPKSEQNTRGERDLNWRPQYASEAYNPSQLRRNLQKRFSSAVPSPLAGFFTLTSRRT